MRKFILLAGLFLATSVAARSEEIKLAFSYELPNVPGLSVTGVVARREW
jgi:hypothetical protein